MGLLQQKVKREGNKKSMKAPSFKLKGHNLQVQSGDILDYLNTTEADQEVNETVQSMKIVRKQMILYEICHDLVKVKEILEGLKKYDKVEKTESQASFLLNLRQKYRKQFTEFIVHGIRDRYAN